MTKSFILTKSICLILIVFVLQSCGYNFNENLNWIFESPKDIPWSNYGMAEKPVIQGDYIVYRGGYFWQNRVYLYVVDKNTGKLLWKNDTSTLQFAVSEDKVVISTRESIHHNYPGSKKQSILICYDLKTGKKLWDFNTEVSTNSPRLLSMAQCVYYWVPGYQLACLSAKNGKKLWDRKYTKKSDFMKYISVTSKEDTIYAAYPQKLMLIIDGPTEKEISSLSLKGTARGRIIKLQLMGDLIALFNNSHFLTVINLKEKKPVLHTRFNEFATQLAQEKNRIYFCIKIPKQSVDIPEAYYLYCIDLKSREKVWEQKLASQPASEPAIGQKNLYIGTTGDDKEFYAFDKESGELSWKQNIGPVKGAPAYKDRTVYLSGGENFYALDAKTGSITWKEKPKKYKTCAGPVIGDNCVYFVAQDANLYNFKLIKPSETNPSSTENPTSKTENTSSEKKVPEEQNSLKSDKPGNLNSENKDPISPPKE